MHVRGQMGRHRSHPVEKYGLRHRGILHSIPRVGPMHGLASSFA
jgi:hypothetical protein